MSLVSRDLRRVDWSAYIFIAPYMLIYVIFLLFPVAWSIVMSFQRGSLLMGMEFCGWCNYTAVWENRLFIQAIRNTVVFTLIVIPGAMILSLMMAVLTDQLPRWLQAFVKVCIFLPMVSSVIALAIIWEAIFTPGPDGPLNWLVGLVGIPPQNWLGTRLLVIPAIAIFEIWRGYGFWVIIFMAGLDSIPRELDDAAKVDGAGSWQIFFNITLPLLKPTFLFLSIMGVIWNFQIFDAVYMLTSGGPANHSTTIVYYVYRSAFHFENLGFASTMGVLLFLAILVFTIIQMRVVRFGEPA